MHKLQKRQIPKRSRANCVTIQLTVRTWSHEPGKQCACPVSRLVHSPGSSASVITWKISTRDSGITIPGSYSLYSTANDPKTANDLQNGPQMILDRKWSPESTANDPVKNWGWKWILWDWLQKRTDYNWKEPNFFSPYNKREGGLHISSQSIQGKKKKCNKSEKDMVSTVYFFLC